MSRAPHLLYGTSSAAEAVSAKLARPCRPRHRRSFRRGRVPILVGGTGLYFKALTEGLAVIPDMPPDIREHWRERAEAQGPEQLHRELAALAIPPWRRGQLTDPQRIARALEVIQTATWGVARPMARRFGHTGASAAGRVEARGRAQREPLYAAIDARFELMMGEGALEEVTALLALGLDPSLPAMRAHGVRELGALILPAQYWKSAVAKAKTETRRYGEAADDLGQTLHDGMGLGARHCRRYRFRTALAARP